MKYIIRSDSSPSEGKRGASPAHVESPSRHRRRVSERERPDRERTSDRAPRRERSRERPRERVRSNREMLREHDRRNKRNKERRLHKTRRYYRVTRGLGGQANIDSIS